MPSIDIEFLDRQLNNTKNTINGSPSVMVYVTIGGHKIVDGLFSIIDTGCEYSVIAPGCLAQPGIQVTPVDTASLTDDVLRTESHDIYEAVVEIDGLKDPRKIYVIAKPVSRHPLLIGRNLLLYYRLVYDPTKPEFTISTP